MLPKVAGGLGMAEGGGEQKVSLGRAAAFISYALPDAVVANSIVENLERQGLRCWLAPREKRPHACGRFTVQSTARTL
jgi:hypothetical protein